MSNVIEVENEIDLRMQCFWLIQKLSGRISWVLIAGYVVIAGIADAYSDQDVSAFYTLETS